MSDVELFDWVDFQLPTRPALGSAPQLTCGKYGISSTSFAHASTICHQGETHAQLVKPTRIGPSQLTINLSTQSAYFLSTTHRTSRAPSVSGSGFLPSSPLLPFRNLRFSRLGKARKSQPHKTLSTNFLSSWFGHLALFRATTASRWLGLPAPRYNHSRDSVVLWTPSNLNW